MFYLFNDWQLMSSTSHDYNHPSKVDQINLKTKQKFNVSIWAKEIAIHVMYTDNWRFQCNESFYFIQNAEWSPMNRFELWISNEFTCLKNWNGFFNLVFFLFVATSLSFLCTLYLVIFSRFFFHWVACTYKTLDGK